MMDHDDSTHPIRVAAIQAERSMTASFARVEASIARQTAELRVQVAILGAFIVVTVLNIAVNVWFAWQLSSH